MNAVIIGIMIFIGTLFSTTNSDAAVTLTTDEVVMYTDVGEVVLTSTPCPKVNTKFTYRAFATDFSVTSGNETHEGCWVGDGNAVHIWFYNEPEQPFEASYAKYHFQPRSKL